MKNQDINEEFDSIFLNFLKRNGYYFDGIFSSENANKFNKYMNEFVKVYSYEKLNFFNKI